jgi:hypothetical protein
MFLRRAAAQSRSLGLLFQKLKFALVAQPKPKITASTDRPAIPGVVKTSEGRVKRYQSHTSSNPPQLAPIGQDRLTPTSLMTNDARQVIGEGDGLDHRYRRFARELAVSHIEMP